LFSARELTPVKMVVMGVEAGFIFKRQPKNSLRESLLGLLMDPLLHRVPEDLF
jgi:hypothetical protein